MPADGGERQKQPSAGISRTYWHSENDRELRHQPFDVARHLIDFQVHTRADNELAQRGHSLGVGNDIDTKLRPLDLVHRQTDPVDGDRPLARDVARKSSGNRNTNSLRARVTADRDNARDAVHVTGHKVPTKGIPHLERGLEVHQGTGTQITQRGQAESFSRYIGSERITRELCCRQAAPLHANTVADAEAIGVHTFELYYHPNVTAARFQCEYATNVLNDSSEHVRSLACLSQSQPQIIADASGIDQREPGGVGELPQLRQLDQ